MQVVDCSRCRKSSMCGDLGRHYLQVIQAALEGRDAVDCPQFEPVFLRGVEGVFPVPPQFYAGAWR